MDRQGSMRCELKFAFAFASASASARNAPKIAAGTVRGARWRAIMHACMLGRWPRWIFKVFWSYDSSLMMDTALIWR